MMTSMSHPKPLPIPTRHAAPAHDAQPGDLRFRAQLFDAVPFCVIYLDANLRYRYVNRKYADTYGLHPDQIVGCRARDILHPETYALVAPLFARVLKGEVPEVLRELTPVGTLGPRNANAMFLAQRAPSGEVTGFFVILLDETELFESRAAAQQLSDRFLRFSQAIHDSVWEWNLDTNEVWHSNLEEQYGAYPQRADMLEWWQSKVHPADRTRATETLTQSLAEGTGWNSTYRMTDRDGRYRNVVDRALIFRDDSGRAVRVVGGLADVTERQRAEILMAEQKHLLERASQGAPLQELMDKVALTIEDLAPEPVRVMVTIRECDHLRLYAGPSLPPELAAMMGTRATGSDLGSCRACFQSCFCAFACLATGSDLGSCEASGRHEQHGIVNDLASAMAPTMPMGPRLLASGLRSCFSVPVATPAGEVVAVLTVLYPQPNRVHLDDISMVEMLAPTVGVIIAHTRAIEALRRQSELTHTISENALAGLFLLDENGRTTYVNRTATVITGYSLKRLESKRLHQMLHSECADENCALQAAMLTGAPLQNYETRIRRRNGTHVEALVNYTPLHQQGHVSGAVLEILDQSERIAARELAETNRQLDEMNRLKSEFVSTMSHELRTPLNAIIGFSEVLLSEMSGPLNETQKRHLRMVSDAGESLLKLVSEILDLSRLEAGKSAIDLKPFDLSACVRASIECLRPDADKKELLLEAVGISHPCEVRSDEQRVRQIILNLVSNAVKFTHDGHVTVRLEEQSDIVRVRVEDSGPGIAQALLKGLFQAFSRTGGDPRNEGTGLGLHISRKLAMALGGTLEMSSDADVGTTVTLTLPRSGPDPSAA